MDLTDEQKDLLILMGKPADGRQPPHFVKGGQRITNELIALGLVHHTGPKAFDLTNAGEALFELLASPADPSGR